MINTTRNRVNFDIVLNSKNSGTVGTWLLVFGIVFGIVWLGTAIYLLETDSPFPLQGNLTEEPHRKGKAGIILLLPFMFVAFIAVMSIAAKINPAGL